MDQYGIILIWIQIIIINIILVFLFIIKELILELVKLLYDYVHKSEYLEMEKNATKSATKISEILDGKDNAGYLIVLKQFWLDDLGNL